jgi:hypothetical protein
MKTQFFGLMAVIGLISCAGCVTRSTTTGPGGVVTNATLSAATVLTLELTAKHAVIYAVEKKPGCLGYFQAASVALDGLLLEARYDSESLRQALNAVKVEELHNVQLQAAIGDLLTIYQAAEGEAVAARLNRSVVLRPALDAVNRGIRLGIAYYQ